MLPVAMRFVFMATGVITGHVDTWSESRIFQSNQFIAARQTGPFVAFLPAKIPA
jgi:hypothetical protein